MSLRISTQGTALITGAAQRIGQRIAVQLSRLGYKIALHYHQSDKEAQKTVQKIKRLGGEAGLFPCDLSQSQAAQSLISRVLKNFPDLNLLINNAAIFKKSSFPDKNWDLFDRHIDINLKAPYILTAQFATACSQGQIINILDTHIVQNQTSHMAYLISKKALAELTKLSAVALAPHIRVNGIAPGLILPPKNKKDNYLHRLANKIPLKTKGNPYFIEQAVEFLLQNPFVTGQILFIDGGENLI